MATQDTLICRVHLPGSARDRTERPFPGTSINVLDPLVHAKCLLEAVRRMDWR